MFTTHNHLSEIEKESKKKDTFSFFSLKNKGRLLGFSILAITILILTLVVDSVPPKIIINLPQPEQNYSSTSVELNVTVQNGDTCKYSLDQFATNTTFSNCTSVLMTAVEGRNIVNVSCNDTSGNENKTGVIFHVDTIASTISDESLNATLIDINAPITLNATVVDATLDVDSVYFYLETPEGDLNLSATSRTIANIKQHYDVNEDTQWLLHDTQWMAQTFTPAADYSIKMVSLKMYRYLTPDTVYVSIYATNASGSPVGSSLVSGTFDGNAITDTSPGEWVNITFSSAYGLTASTMYAIVAHSDDTGVDWRGDKTAPAYAGGTRAGSGDSGTTWVPDSGDDLMFRTYSQINEYSVICNISGGSTGTCFTNVTGSYNYTSVWANDTVGNVNSTIVNLQFNVSYYDIIPPNIVINLPLPNSNHSTTLIELNVTITDDGVGVDQCWYSLDNLTTNTTWANCTSIIITGVEGLNNLYVGANDTLGNVNTSGQLNFTIDNSAPIIAYVIPPTPDNNSRQIGNSVTINVSYIDPLIQRCQINWSGIVHEMVENDSTNFWIIFPTVDGVSYWFNVTCNDTLGNQNTTETYHFTENSVPVAGTPTISVTDYVSSAYCHNTTFTDNESDNASFYYIFWVNGNLAQNSNSSRLDDAHFVQGDRIICGIIPFDNWENGTSVNSSEGQVGSWNPPGTGGGEDFPPVLVNITINKTFIVTPRTIDIEFGDIPTPVTLKKVGVAERLITNLLNESHIIRVFVRSYDYTLPSGLTISSSEMITVEPSGVLNLTPLGNITLKITSKIPSGAVSLYKVDIFVIGSQEELISITLDGREEEMEPEDWFNIWFIIERLKESILIVLFGFEVKLFMGLIFIVFVFFGIKRYQKKKKEEKWITKK